MSDQRSTVLAHAVILRPVISEKSTHLHENNQYVFEVAIQANKTMIKKAIQQIYQKEPVMVRIIRMRGKAVQRGKYKGSTRNRKKAVITMPKGVTLPVYEGV